MISLAGSLADEEAEMDVGAGTSKYLAVRGRLLERVSAMTVGDRLPSETELCDEFGVSRITLRHAVDGLVQDGRLAREHGRGTFVTEPPTAPPLKEHFTDIVTGFHRQQTTAGNLVETRVLRQELIPADAQVAGHLLLEPGAAVVELVRLRHVNGELHHHVVTYLSNDRFPDVFTADLSSGSLFEFLSDRYGTRLVRNDIRVRVEPASADIALKLTVPTGFRLLAIDSTVADESDVPVAYGTARYTPDHGEISLNLRSPQTHP